MTTIEKIPVNEKLAAAFDELQGQLPGVASIRTKAIEDFKSLGLPGRKNEEYKYSNTLPLFKDELSIGKAVATKGIAPKSGIPGLKANTAVLVNGIFSEELSSAGSLAKGAVVCSLVKAFQTHKDLIAKHFSAYAPTGADAFIALNTALFQDGIFVYVPDEVVAETPLQIIHIITANEPSLVFPRALFVTGTNASLQVVETIESGPLKGRTIVDAVTEVFVAEGARVQYYKLQNEGAGLVQVNAIKARQEKASHFDTNTVTLKGGWIRNNLDIALEGQQCETHLNGLFITEGEQHVDNHTLVDHRMPHCESNQLYKGILGDKSTGIFNGKIFVQRDAQKTNAYQSSKNILLTDDATINTKPQLEIYADDVKCSHGSSTGKLDEDAMFYLRARGLGVDSARTLLLYAFAADVLETIRIKELKDHLNELVQQRLEQ